MPIGTSHIGTVIGTVTAWWKADMLQLVYIEQKAKKVQKIFTLVSSLSSLDLVLASSQILSSVLQ